MILGNNGPSGDFFLPDHMTAAEFIEFRREKMWSIQSFGRGMDVTSTAKFSAKTKGRSDFFAEILTKPFYEQPVVGDFIEIRNHQRELLRQMVGLVRGGSGSYLIKSAEGFGKTTSHFSELRDDMRAIALAQPPGSPIEIFGCFAFRSYEQAEQKANEFRERNPDCNAAVIKSFNLIYKEFCEQEGEQPIDRVHAEGPTLSFYLAEIREHQPNVFDLLENYRTTLWEKNKFLGGATILFTTHAIIQSWHESRFTRLWHHPQFDPENFDWQEELRNAFVIAEVIFDELEIDEFLDCLPDKLFQRIKGFQAAHPRWTIMPRADRVAIYGGTGDLPKVNSFEDFDYLMRLNLNEFDEVTVDFDEIPFGHGNEKNLYKKQNGRSYHLGIREWPFNFRIGFLTTEMLTASVVEEVFEKHAARVATVQTDPTRSEEATNTKLNLTGLNIPDSPFLYPIKIPLFIDARARANQTTKPGVTQLAKEIVDANPDAVVIANGTKGDVERVQTFQRCKGKNDLIDKDIYIVVTHLALDQYAEFNVIGQWLGIPNIINLFYMDQINQAVGRNQGFRQSDQRETKTVLITSKRLFDSVISKCCSEEGSRTAII